MKSVKEIVEHIEKRRDESIRMTHEYEGSKIVSVYAAIQIELNRLLDWILENDKKEENENT